MGVHTPEGLKLDLQDILENQVQDALESGDESVRNLGRGMLSGSVLLTEEPHISESGRPHEAKADVELEDEPEAIAESQRISGQELDAQLTDPPAQWGAY